VLRAPGVRGATRGRRADGARLASPGARASRRTRPAAANPSWGWEQARRRAGGRLWSGHTGRKARPQGQDGGQTVAVGTGMLVAGGGTGDHDTILATLKEDRVAGDEPEGDARPLR